MIPKIIHYIWMGGTPLSSDAIKCIESWKNHCPDFEIVEWNENNFDISICSYVEEAYKARKWAFVSDYVRLWVLVHYGGIYMDTDVEVLRSLNCFLNLRAFSGFENERDIPTGIMGSEKRHPFFEILLAAYKDIHFVNNKGYYDLTTNVTRITNICVKNGLIRNNTKQTVCDFTLFPRDYFCPLDSRTGELHITNNTYTIHWFCGSWKSEEERIKHQKAMELSKKGCLGPLLAFFYEKSFKVVYIVKKGSVGELTQRIIKYFCKRVG